MKILKNNKYHMCLLRYHQEAWPRELCVGEKEPGSGILINNQCAILIELPVACKHYWHSPLLSQHFKQT